MLRDEIKQLQTAPKDLRKFGLLVGGIFCLLALWWWWRGKLFYPYALIPGIPLVILGAVLPRALKWIYIGWMSLALVLGLIVSTILLTVFFYAVVTPIGLVARLMKKDFMTRRLDPAARSYWVEHPHAGSRDRERYEQQF